MVVLLATGACGMDVQTTQPYTPGDGVNVNVGAGARVQVRNLLIISGQPGQGILAAGLSANQPDALTAVSGTASALDGSGTPLTGTVAQPLEVGPGELVLLTQRAPIEVRSPALAAGLTAQVRLEFREAGAVTVRVPVMDADIPYYETITPLATPSP